MLNGQTGVIIRTKAIMIPAITLDPRDNLAVALRTLEAGEELEIGASRYRTSEKIPAKQKFAMEALSAGQKATMYGVTVGVASTDIPQGGLIHTGNLTHDADEFSAENVSQTSWTAPDVSSWKERTFQGYHRSDGSVGTANHWIVVPMVFCETRNINAMRTAFERALGYEKTSHYRDFVETLADSLKSGASPDELRSLKIDPGESGTRNRLFSNIDGVKFLTHHLGCGGTRADANDLCGLLAGYITHPNVAGATVLSLGCENAQVEILEKEIEKRSPGFDKPLHIFRQQTFPDEKVMLETAIRETFASLVEINQCTRQPASLDKLTVGVECGGSDGFSGISANPTIGAVSDRLVALQGKVILSEFPELCGVEQELLNRCVTPEIAARFAEYNNAYAEKARAVGSDFSQNPSPGNIKDGLITDAIKSAGAAKKGGTSPIVDVLDYPSKVTEPGLSLLCTPGGDVESTTAMAGSHANLILFSTGLGTPTGNPVCPVIKVSSNTELSERLPDMIDFNTGGIIRGESTIDEEAERMLELMISVASGEQPVKAQLLGQDDFLPWKRGVSL